MRVRWIAVSFGVLASLAAISAPVTAGERGWSDGLRQAGHRSGPRVKGYVKRRGGYSYNYEESINTYGDSRGRFGSARSFRDPRLDRQTQGGPFDHGFFFDSGSGSTYGGEAPYMH